MRAVLAISGAFALAAVTGGCATTGTKGVVPIGQDLYMVGGLGGFTDYSGSEVKARFFQQAAKFCQDRGQVMVPVTSTGQDAVMANYASAEVQFRCVAAGAPPFSR